MPDDEVTTTDEGEVEEAAEGESEGEPAAESEGEPSGEEAKASPEGEESEYETDLQKKFKGDFKAADRSYWNLVQHASRVKDENRILRERLALADKAKSEAAKLEARPAEKPASEPPAKPPEALAEVDQRIEGLKARQNELAQNYNQNLLNLSETDKAIAKLEQKLEDAVDMDKPPIEARLEAVKTKREGIIGSLYSIKDRVEELIYRRERMASERDVIQRDLKGQQDQQSRVQAEREEVNREFPQEVDNIFDQVCIELAVDIKDKEFRQDLAEIVNEDLMAKLWAAGANGYSLADVDIEGLIRTKIEKVLRHRDGGRAQFAKVSKEKLDLAAKAGTKVGPAGGKLKSGLDQMKMARLSLAKAGL